MNQPGLWDNPESAPAPEKVSDSQPAGLFWTFHPLVDMGIATLVALSHQQHPRDVTMHDLEEFANYAQRSLTAAALRSHASVLFTINVPYLQPSFKPDKQADKARQIFHAFRVSPPPDAPPCAYCGRPSIRLDTDTGRAYREMVPLLTGQGTVNFAPYGQHGLSVCGLCLTALQALSFGAPSCQGRALIVAADDPDQLVPLVTDWLGPLQARIQLSAATGQKVDTWQAPRTRLVQHLVHLAQQGGGSSQPCSFTVFHASNSGQGPELSIFRLTAPAVTFARRAQLDVYLPAWTALELAGWQDAKRRAADHAPNETEAPQWRNEFYDALFSLPDSTTTVLQRYFLSRQMHSIRPQQNYPHVPLWELTRLFLEEILGMEAARIAAIRSLGDAFADEVTATNNLPLLNRLLRARSYGAVRDLILKSSYRRVATGLNPLLTFDGFLSVFEEAEELPRRDWRLAWDLVLIRLLDHANLREWLARDRKAAEQLAEAGEDSADVEDETLPVGVGAA